VPLQIAHPIMMLAFLVLAAVSFSLFGFILGIWADGFERLQIVPMLILTPLTFLGGTFYSIDMLAEPWRTVAQFNPIFYLINAVRYGFLGTSDVSVLLSLAVTGALAAAVVAWSAWLFRTGHRLKP